MLEGHWQEMKETMWVVWWRHTVYRYHYRYLCIVHNNNSSSTGQGDQGPPGLPGPEEEEAKEFPPEYLPPKGYKVEKLKKLPEPNQPLTNTKLLSNVVYITRDPWRIEFEKSVCVRACVRVCVCVRACVCMRVCGVRVSFFFSGWPWFRWAVWAQRCQCEFVLVWNQYMRLLWICLESLMNTNVLNQSWERERERERWIERDLKRTLVSPQGAVGGSHEGFKGEQGILGLPGPRVGYHGYCKTKYPDK